MVQDLIKDLLLQHLGPLKKSRKGWLTRNCMLCHIKGEGQDTRRRFGIMFSPDGRIAIHCFNCSYEAVWAPGRTFNPKFERFMREIGISDYDIKQLNFQLFKEQNSMEVDQEVKLRGAITKDWKKMDLIEGALPITEWAKYGCKDENFLRSAEYAMTRGFNLDDIYWTPTKDFTFHKRIILPFKYKGEIVGYTGRYFKDDIRSKTFPKYINRMPTNYIYNLDAQQDFDRKYLIVCEGVFDAYLMDGVSPINNTLSDEQAQIITSLGKKIILCPDMDSAGEELVHTALKHGWAVSFPSWGDTIKDPAKAVEHYGRILTLQSIIESSEQNKTKIEVMWKMGKHGRNQRI